MKSASRQYLQMNWVTAERQCKWEKDFSDQQKEHTVFAKQIIYC